MVPLIAPEASRMSAAVQRAIPRLKEACTGERHDDTAGLASLLFFAKVAASSMGRRGKC